MMRGSMVRSLCLGALVLGATPVAAHAAGSNDMAYASGVDGVMTITLGRDNANNSLQLSIDPKAAGPEDDQLLYVGQLDTPGFGCVFQASPALWRCPLKFGIVLTRQIVITAQSASETVAPMKHSFDIDRLGTRMKLIYTGLVSELDGTATEAGDFVVSTDKSGALVRTGAGNDAISVFNQGPGPGGHFEGGPGDDSLSGAGSSDTLLGGSGDDTLLPGGGAPNAVDGGEGSRDAVGFANLAAGLGVVASLDGVANDTAGPNAFTITNVEDLSGTEANDKLTGNSGFNHINGLGGADDIDGGGGGHDVLRGGLDGDKITARDIPAAFSDVGCGAGADTAVVDSVDLVASDCESVDRSPAATGPGTGGPGGGAGPGSGPGGSTTGLDGDKTAPKFTLSSLAKRIKRATARSRGIGFYITLNEVSRLELELLATAPGGRLKDNLVLVRRTISKARTGATRIRLFPDKALLRLGRIRLRIRATDGEGNLRMVTRTITVRR